MDQNNSIQTVSPEATASTNTNAPQNNAPKAKFTIPKMSCLKTRFRPLLRRLIRGLAIGFVIGIVLNVIDAHFWTELSETIPAIFGFFNGFVTFMEFVYKVALGGIASIFNGTFLEFNKSVNSEFLEMVKEFWNWMSSLSF